MIRATGREPSRSEIQSVVLPAAMDTTSASRLIVGRIVSSTAGSTCGLTQSITVSLVSATSDSFTAGRAPVPRQNASSFSRSASYTSVSS